MKSKLALEKHAEAVMSISNSLMVAGGLAPFSYLLDISSLGPVEQLILRIAPFAIIAIAAALHVIALKWYDRLSEMS